MDNGPTECQTPARMRARGTRTQPVAIHDPWWSFTFPQVVKPRRRDDESFIGLLLRCDFANSWPAGVSLQLSSTVPMRQYPRAVMWSYNVQIDALADALARTPRAVRSTTYEAELTALYTGTATGRWADLLGLDTPFQICPRCIADGHLLRRSHLLPGLTHCPVHHVKLCRECACRAPLQAFRAKPFPRLPRRLVMPYVCSHCGHPWESLPCQVGGPDELDSDQHLFNWYETFLTHATPEFFMRALALLDHRPGEHQSNTDGLTQVVRRYETVYPRGWDLDDYPRLANVCAYLAQEGFLPACAAQENFATCRRRFIIWDEVLRQASVSFPKLALDAPCACGDQTWREGSLKFLVMGVGRCREPLNLCC